MRSALEQIKAELGADAVIMSNKKIPEGVELMAAVDYAQQTASAEGEFSGEKAEQTSPAVHGRNIDNDVVSIRGQNSTSVANESAPADSLSALLQRQAKAQATNPTAAPDAQFKQQNHAPANNAQSDIEQQLKAFTDRLEQSSHGATQVSDETSSLQTRAQQQESRHLSPQRVSAVQERESSKAVTVNYSEEMEQMRQEMLSMRQLLEHQLSGLMWQDMAQKDPLKALLVNRLLALGLNEHVAEQIAHCIPANLNEENAWAEAKKLLAQQLHTTNNEIIHRGGVVSLVGPTGVGKTTTIAKLAARFAQIHGADQVAMISTDNYRIAGFEQLTTYGRIIGCQVKLAKDGAALETLLQQFSDKKLVLIDTAGMGQRDMRLAEHLATLITNSRVRIRNYLVLAANAQQRVMQENVDRFKKVPLAGCIYTKLDESLSVGEIIATSIQNGLPIGYLTDGQRVPEDIKVANSGKLVTLADRLSSKVNRQDSRRPMPTSQAVAM